MGDQQHTSNSAGPVSGPLLTDGAVRAAIDAARHYGTTNGSVEAINALLRFHATEGREALVEQVALALRGADNAVLSDARYRRIACVAVAALFGDELPRDAVTRKAARHEDLAKLASDKIHAALERWAIRWDLNDNGPAEARPSRPEGSL